MSISNKLHVGYKYMYGINVYSRAGGVLPPCNG